MAPERDGPWQRHDIGHMTRLGSRVFRPVGAGPELLCLFVTSRCDARCAHCFDWQRRGREIRAQDLSREELSRVARNLPPLYFLLLTGGEPFLRPDMGELAVELASHARPRVLAIPTNGGRTAEILHAVEVMLDGLPTSVSLSINVSLDGVGELHDTIRGVPGLFGRAVETLRGLQQLAARRQRLAVGVVTVASRFNQEHLFEVMDFVLDDLRVPIWAPFLTRGAPRDPTAGEVDIDRYVEVTRELEQRVLTGRYGAYRGFVGASVNNAKNMVRREMIHQTVLEGRRVSACRAGGHSAVVWANGDVHPCELLGESMGNVRDHGYDLRRLWRSPGAHAARQAVAAAPCACTHENTLTTSIAFDWRQWGSLLRWALAFASLPVADSDAASEESPDSGPRRPTEPEEAPAPASVDGDGQELEVSCFIPALNEERLIRSTVRILDRVLGRLARSHEIIVVDDGSSDRTSHTVAELGNERVRAITCPSGPSFRGNLSRHLLSGRGAYVFYMDADLTANERDVGRLLASLRSGADAAIGSRYAEGAKAVRMPVRLAMSRGYNKALQVLLDSPFADHQCGLKGFRREALGTLLAAMKGSHRARRWFWDAELIIRAHHGGYRVDEIPVTWVCRVDSRFMAFRQPSMLPWILKLRRELRS